MKATHVGNLDGKRLYFIFEEPPSRGNNGAIVAPDGQVDYVPFWSFVSRKSNIEKLAVNKFQKFLWNGSSGSMANTWNGVFVEELIPVPKDMLASVRVVTEFPNLSKQKVREKDLRGSDFRRLLNSGHGDSYAFKRLRGRIGRATRMATGGARGFVRGAVFNPNAEDADGDGFVQEGTQFARPASARVERAARGFASGLRQRTTPPYQPKLMRELDNLGLLPKTRDTANTKKFARELWQRLKYRGDRSKIQKAALDKLLKRFFDEYGDIKTHKDAYDMWERLAPGVSIKYENTFIPNDNSPMDAATKGMHLGYMMGYLLNKERFDKIDLALESKKKANTGGATSWSIPVRIKRNPSGPGYYIEGYNPRVKFIMTANDLDSISGAFMDGVPTQIPVSMSRTEDGFDLSEFPSLRQAFGDNTRGVPNAMYNFLVGLHEAGHAAHNLASMEDRGLIGKRRRDIVNDLIKALSDPDVYREAVDNETFSMMSLASQRVAVANVIWLGQQKEAGVDAGPAMNQLMMNPMQPMNDFIAGAKEFFDSDEWKSIIVDPDGNERELTPSGLDARISITLAMLPEDFRKKHQYVIEMILEQALVNAAQQPDAAPLLQTQEGIASIPSTIFVPVGKISDDIIATLEDARKITAQIVSGFKDKDPNRKEYIESLVTGYKVYSPRQIITGQVTPRGSAMRRLKESMMNAVRSSPVISTYKKEQVAKYQNADIDELLKTREGAQELIDLLTELEFSDRRKYGMDKLTDEQVALIWDISRQISEYASYDQHSLYSFTGGGVMPIEMIAEMLPALLVDPEGFFQKLSASELEALTKLVTWIYGPEFAQTLLEPLAPKPKKPNPTPEGPTE